VLVSSGLAPGESLIRNAEAPLANGQAITTEN
jgi:hypothetical protein